jgi:hypothetical protein
MIDILFFLRSISMKFCCFGCGFCFDLVFSLLLTNGFCVFDGGFSVEVFAC